MRTDRQTDMTKLKAAFGNFANAPKNESNSFVKITLSSAPKGRPFGCHVQDAAYY
jgi:hypothetical protein